MFVDQRRAEAEAKLLDARKGGRGGAGDPLQTVFRVLHGCFLLLRGMRSFAFQGIASCSCVTALPSGGLYSELLALVCHEQGGRFGSSSNVERQAAISCDSH